MTLAGPSSTKERLAIEPVAGGVRVSLRVTPRAAHNNVGPLVEIADGRFAIKVAITAVAEDGKANKAVIALLAKEWRLAKGSISIVTGSADRTKVLLVAGDPNELSARLGAWVAGLVRRP